MRNYVIPYRLQSSNLKLETKIDSEEKVWIYQAHNDKRISQFQGNIEPKWVGGKIV